MNQQLPRVIPDTYDEEWPSFMKALFHERAALRLILGKLVADSFCFQQYQDERNQYEEEQATLELC